MSNSPPALLPIERKLAQPATSGGSTGTVEVSVDDGLTGTADLHVAGPGAPQINDYARHVSIVAAPDR